ncbi:hypothetical protein B0H15DRAFT_851839 [Mycena belliarum]|uniref:Uncharacterized protein n=1 Tax=Mycena belliarum TaxID=1033014 RepID=A0AAD6U2Y8_9AGAR|nr:hypothetical protein B0H15DRAFT_851839 [Mycena belliae]
MYYPKQPSLPQVMQFVCKYLQYTYTTYSYMKDEYWGTFIIAIVSGNTRRWHGIIRRRGGETGRGRTTVRSRLARVASRPQSTVQATWGRRVGGWYGICANRARPCDCANEGAQRQGGVCARLASTSGGWGPPQKMPGGRRLWRACGNAGPGDGRGACASSRFEHCARRRARRGRTAGAIGHRTCHGVRASALGGYCSWLVRRSATLERRR